MQAVLLTHNVGALLKREGGEAAAARAAVVTEFWSTLQACPASFVAVHLQECIAPMEVLQPLLDHPAAARFARRHVLLDTCDQTALCSLYMFDPSAVDAALVELRPPEGAAAVANGASPTCSLPGVEPIPAPNGLVLPIPKEVLPHPGRYHQKGAMFVAWSLNGTSYGFVNVHLPHETDNCESVKCAPSIVAQNRAAALEWSLARCAAAADLGGRLFVMGDFNFRPSLRGVLRATLKARLPGAGPSVAPMPDEPSDTMRQQAQELAFQWEIAEANKRLEPVGGCCEVRKFSAGRLADSFALPAPANPLWPHDERHLLTAGLLEAPVTFPPSYGYGGKKDGRIVWTKKRCPAWPDRVLMTPAAMPAVEVHAYSAVGLTNDDIVDHKPVYLHATLR